MMRCEDYPCCGHTYDDPCDPRNVIDEPQYCDDCGYMYYGLTCPCDSWDDEDDDDEPYDEGYYYSGTGEWSEDDSYIDYINRY